MFGAIERDIKKHDTLLTDEDYIKIFEWHATIICLGKDCPVYDRKTSSVYDIIKKPASWYFKLQPCKRVVVSRTKNNPERCLVRGEVNYNQNVGEGKSRPILKQGKAIQSLQPVVIPEGVLLKNAKIKDMKTLLSKHFLKDWSQRESLTFYNNVFDQQEQLRITSLMKMTLSQTLGKSEMKM